MTTEEPYVNQLYEVRNRRGERIATVDRDVAERMADEIGGTSAPFVPRSEPRRGDPEDWPCMVHGPGDDECLGERCLTAGRVVCQNTLVQQAKAVRAADSRPTQLDDLIAQVAPQPRRIESGGNAPGATVVTEETPWGTRTNRVVRDGRTRNGGRAATEPQKALIRDLLAQREGNEQAERLRASLNVARQDGRLTTRAASDAINALMAIPRNAPVPAAGQPQQARPNFDDLPEGRYALATQEGHLAFYQVDKPQSGKWAGYTFCALLLGSPGDFDKQRLSRQTSESIMARIAEDPAAAALAFSRKFTVCAKCLAPLSQVRSRATGFGPVCAGHLGVRYLPRDEALRVLQEEGISTEGLEDLEEGE